MYTLSTKHTYFEPVGQGAQQLHFDWQANERCHAAVGDGGCELNFHSALCIINLRKRQVERDSLTSAIIIIIYGKLKTSNFSGRNKIL